MTMVQNMGLAAFNFGVGYLNTEFDAGKDNIAGYWPGLLVFSTVGFFGLLWAWLLKRSDAGPDGHGLEKVVPVEKPESTEAQA
jgi:hypothetical protein